MDQLVIPAQTVTNIIGSVNADEKGIKQYRRIGDTNYFMRLCVVVTMLEHWQSIAISILLLSMVTVPMALLNRCERKRRK